MKKTIDSVDVDRRTVLRGAGALAVSGMLAGCGGDDGDENSGDGDVPSEVSDYLDGANNFDGSVADETDADSVTIMVGAGSNNLAFDPAAVRISTGTAVTWEWTGQGGGHNVVAEDGTFTSGDEFISEEGHTYEYTFEETGNYNYACTPHKGSGMKGAVIVE
jgi:halocyanin-like protein